MTWLRHRVREFAGGVVNTLASSGFLAPYLDRRSITRRELEGLADNRGRLWRFGNEEHVRLVEPYHVGELPPEIGDDIGRDLRIERPFVCELRDAELIGPRGITVAEDGRYVLENSLGYREALAQHLLLSLASGTLPVRRRTDGEHDIDAAVSLVGPWTDGYFHWFSDWLPRLEGVEYYASVTGIEPTLIVPRTATTWMRDSLRSLGYDDWIEWDGSRARVDRLVVPTARHDAGTSGSAQDYVHSPAAYEWVRDRILEGVDTGRSDSLEADRVFVSRRDAPVRRIVNEEAVWSLLDERGFERRVLSELDFAEQVVLFSAADAVVAPHGAGLTNMLYGDDLAVVELFGRYVNPCYFTMAGVLGFTYACMQCEPVGDDLAVDVDDLRRLLDGIGIQ